MRKLFIFALILLAGFNAVLSYAASIPRSTVTDRHVKVVQYDPNNIVILKGRYGYQIQVTFAPNEVVQSVSLGDSMAWQAVPVSNNLFIKPVAESTTNMTVLTNVNSYIFELDSTNPNVAPTYKLQFSYPSAGYDQGGVSNAMGTFDPDKMNWKYSFTGDKNLAPVEAFDDGQFTYFRYKTDGMSHLPAVFIVDKDRNESLVNYHMRGKYLVVNAVAKQFTLRDGGYVTSVYNDLAIGDWKKLN